MLDVKIEVEDDDEGHRMEGHSSSASNCKLDKKRAVSCAYLSSHSLPSQL
jgi:hypothetical protein